MIDEREVLEAVKKEVDSIGSLAKENIEKLNNHYKNLTAELKTQGEKVDALQQLKIDRLATDISVRQEEMDKKAQELKAGHEALQKHLEALDVAIQRNKFSGNGTDEKAVEEIKQFVCAINAIKKKDSTPESLAEQIDTVAAEMPEYKKVFELFLRRPGDERQLTPDQMKTLSVGSDPDGGFAVTPTLSSRVITKLFESSPLRSLAGVETITSDAIEMMTDIDDSANCGWEGEQILGDMTDTPKASMLRIPVHNMYARARATQKLLEDSGINIESWLGDKIGSKMARTEATSFVTGTGVGQPRGFLTYAAGSAWGQIEQVAMGDSSLLTADGFISLKYAMVESLLERGTWLMNRSTVAAAMKLKNGTTAEYIWKPSMLEKDPSSTILGLPVRMAADMPAVAANSLAVALADWREAYLIVDRLGTTVQRDPYTAKPLVEFYFRRRLGGDIVNFQAIKIGKIAAS